MANSARATTAHFIAADGHFVGAPEEAKVWDSLLERAFARGAKEVSLLGDLFELWLGLAGLEAPWHDAIVRPLARLRERGVYLRYVVGNKDYFVEEWNARHRVFDTVVATSCTIDSPQGPLVLAHGDLVNHADKQYRLWRAVSRSRPFAWSVRALPRRLLARLATHVADAIKGTNRYHKSYFPEAELRARARECPPGPATLIFGHFHVHREIVDKDKRIITLPFLGGERAGLLVSERGFERLSV